MGSVEIRPTNSLNKTMKETSVGFPTVDIVNCHVDKFHKHLGHPDEEIMRDTATSVEVELFGKPSPCEACALGKIKKKKLKKLNKIDLH